MAFKCGRTDCMYHSRETAAWGCDYSDITGRTRTGTLRSMGKPVKITRRGCPLYKEGEHPEVSFRTVNWMFKEPPKKRKTKYDWNKVWELYEQGLNDHEIALKMGCAHQTICAFRKKNNLPSNFKRNEDE